MDADEAAAPLASPEPESVLPPSPLPLLPTGDWEYTKVYRQNERMMLKSCIFND